MALRGAIGFLSTLPVGRFEGAWEAFARRPAVMVVVGYVLGPLFALPLFVELPSPIAGFGFVLAIAVVGGINHWDGLLDVADGVATHGDAAAARETMKDSAIGVGAVLTLGVAMLGLFALGSTLAGAGLDALRIVLAGEVAAKLAMVVVLSIGTASHEGLGSALSTSTSGVTLPMAVALALPATLATWPHPAAAGAILSGGLTGLALERWADGRLGGINGDVLGATNELARLAALLVGVIAWTLW